VVLALVAGLARLGEDVVDSTVQMLRTVPVLALVPLMIRWGQDASSDMLRQSARCTICGRKGTKLQHPSWGGSDVGFQPFPTDD